MQKEKLDCSGLIYYHNTNTDMAGQPLRSLADTPNCFQNIPSRKPSLPIEMIIDTPASSVRPFLALQVGYAFLVTRLSNVPA